jgi:hypothetical protein
VVKVGSSNYRKLVANGGTPSGWTGFEAARPETGTPTFSEIVPPSGELYANPAASQQMLDDAMFDVEAFLANEIATEFARAEGKAFVTGTGVNQPLGFLASPTAITGDSSRAMGTLQTIGTGVAGAFPATAPQDKLLDLVQLLRQPYRQGAVFVMNSATASVIRKFKTSDGAFLWQPSMVSGQPATLLGYPLIEAEDMPDLGASSLSVAFGNFKQGYVIAERGETSILRDPYSHKPYVHFYATQQLDLLVQPVVEAVGANTPPGAPAAGVAYLVGSAPTGAWSGQSLSLAGWTEGGWRFVRPFEGMQVNVRSSGQSAVYRAGAWAVGMLDVASIKVGGVQVLGAQRPAVAMPAGGSIQDVESRAAINAELGVLRAHGLIAT